MYATGQSGHFSEVEDVEKTRHHSLNATETVERDEMNVGQKERAISALGGSFLATVGLGRRDLTGLVMAGIGGGLLYRGLTGRCTLYSALGVNSARHEIQMRTLPDRGIHFSQSLLIDKSPEELYQFWRNFENLPRIMSHLKAVQILDSRRSRWVAKAPSIAGGEIEWEAEIVADEPNQKIAWQSLPGASVESRGSVEFLSTPGDRGTGVRVVMDYRPPAGEIGRWVAKLFGEEPEQQVWEDLRQFKRVMETGEIATIEGQSRGTCLGKE